MKKKSKITKVAFLAFFVYVVVTFAAMQIDISSRKEALVDVNSKVQHQSIINKEIKEILNSGENSEYIIKMAREKLGLAFPDERVFIDITGN